MKKILSEMEVTKVGMNHDRDHIRIYILGGHLIHKKNIFELERSIENQIFKGKRMTVKIIEKYRLSEQYTARTLLELYKDSILEELKEYSLMEYNLLRASKMEFTDDSHMKLVLENTIIAQTRSHEIVEFLEKDGTEMKVDMGYASFGAERIPVVGFGKEIINESIFFCDNFYNATCVSVGNPNCVLMMEEISPNKAMQLGPYVEHSKYFPNRINMQLCHVTDRENIQVEIYERGAGYTYASGTGACAAAAAAHRLGMVGDRVMVHMQGGKLLVEFDRDGRIYMTGRLYWKYYLSRKFFCQKTCKCRENMIF